MRSRDIYDTGFDESNGKTIDAATCPECVGDIVAEGGERACTECGLVLDEYRLDHSGEAGARWDDERNRERTGAPLTPARHDRGLSTEIGWSRDGHGNTLSGGKRRVLRRLRRQHNRARLRTKADRNLAHGFREVRRITGALDLPTNVRDCACALFRAAQREGLLRGRSIESFAAGSVYAVCRCDGYLRTIDEVIDVAYCDRSGLLNAYRVLNVECGLEAEPPQPREFVHRFTSTLDASNQVREEALNLAARAEEAGLANGRNPAGVAAGCVYLVAQESDEKVTQAELADVAGVSDVTIRNRYRELRDQQLTEGGGK